ncbi:hypothetical protein EVJ58_g3132 [Rhodofomes roseus]|uniref:Ubiquinol-cytochrome C reductase hinge domain-containing protein n=1 Tax=Rhodofomes roseus TaxID=34475 RepID=A0A4Y9YNB9_9APHY|nr:hypothetical protein EVJ58_g3132 [Rhodofomes roseus]
MRLSDVDDDTLILLFSFMPVRSILAMRQPSDNIRPDLQAHAAHLAHAHRLAQRLSHPGALRRVSLPAPATRHHERGRARARRLPVRYASGAFWRSPEALPREALEFRASFGTGVEEVRILPGHDGRRVATLSKGIWSVVACWESMAVGGAASVMRAKWSPKGTIITGLVANSDAESEVAIAVSTHQHGSAQRIELLALEKDDDCFRSIGTIDTAMRPIALRGDLLAYSDDSCRTVITNWKTDELALLQGADEPVDQHFQYNRCLQVVFAHKSILVVRARSIELFPEPVLQPPDECPTYRPLAFHSFGWIDGVSVNVQMQRQGSDATIAPLSILLRAESDDPWLSDVHTLDLYVLEPNPAYTEVEVDSPQEDAPSSGASPSGCRTSCPPAPYLFPPVHSSLSSPSVRGFLRCTAIVLGAYGTALWIQPRPARSVDLTDLDVHQSETARDWPAGQEKEVIAGTVFAGPLRDAMFSDHANGGEASEGGEGVDAMSSLSSFFSSFLPTAHADAPPPEVEAHKEEVTPDEPEEGAEGGEAEEEEEEEPEDILPALREECEESAKCKTATEHFRHCEEKVNAGNGYQHEDCIEEFCAYAFLAYAWFTDMFRMRVGDSFRPHDALRRRLRCAEALRQAQVEAAPPQPDLTLELVLGEQLGGSAGARGT